MGGKGIPADVVALSVPIAFAAGAFSFVIYRAFAYDPEWTNGITPETPEAVKKGEVYRNQIQGFFRGRSMSLFNNEVKLDN
mmetsp:Transcript_976/g.2119  ORF Transcript_976/g.2119 Transcript_976/m.2119 type:complete len:81 (-) Transcript_976:390-632(-)|eukprot:CAMPEP_0202900944 /NCGR_PEP_ID=MMETSP1392-20130828/12268_1 /ASSEMBLY_ACC=CAM_ASM_000868 /TAXON_ID=225041 /ORGANISM="Chlamydomonas chlamydogama, Strain SAG 11-48b" /LENGTH=80 /DNA_ID=CAMNT_0049587407 /DNA_START=94 /DNA_END=336 /DNA_ORIENTATION=+